MYDIDKGKGDALGKDKQKMFAVIRNSYLYSEHHEALYYQGSSYMRPHKDNGYRDYCLE